MKLLVPRYSFAVFYAVVEFTVEYNVGGMFVHLLCISQPLFFPINSLFKIDSYCGAACWLIHLLRKKKVFHLNPHPLF